jgi:hypothetical protein
MSNIEKPDKEEQPRTKRYRSVKHFLKIFKVTSKVILLYRTYKIIEDPISSFLGWLFTEDGSGPLDNYCLKGLKY